MRSPSNLARLSLIIPFWFTTCRLVGVRTWGFSPPSPRCDGKGVGLGSCLLWRCPSDCSRMIRVTGLVTTEGFSLNTANSPRPVSNWGNYRTLCPNSLSLKSSWGCDTASWSSLLRLCLGGGGTRNRTAEKSITSWWDLGSICPEFTQSPLSCLIQGKSPKVTISWIPPL